MKERDHLIKDVDKWPISQFYAQRESKVQMLSKDIVDYLIKYNDSDSLLQILNQTIYNEKLRVRTNPLKVDPPKEIAYWKKMEDELSQAVLSKDPTEAIEDKIRRICFRYSEEITGDFRPKTFSFARKALTVLFGAIFNPFIAHDRRAFWGSKEAVLDKFRILGPLDHIRSLFDKGTVLILPTHSSNLDSILIGYGIEMLTGLPAFSYGAGLNLYNSEMVGYFFNRLGAYRVDRRKKNAVYLNTLKTMSSLSIKRGVHSLFFPGGTRSRSGAIEDRFKLGLLGTAVEAQRMILESNETNKIYIVPLVLGYHSILEGNFLIDQHLKKTGREKYFASKDEFRSIRSILKFAWQFFSVSSNISLSFGDPIDIAGNRVNIEGQSFDENNNPISIKDYFLGYDEVEENRQREQVYTRILSDQILNRFKSENIVLDSHLVAFAAFNYLKKEYKNIDVFGIIQMPSEEYKFDLKKLSEVIESLLVELRDRAERNEIKLSKDLQNQPLEIIRSGVRNLGIFHAKKPLKFNKKEELISQDFKLLFYYHNRLTHFDLESAIPNIFSKEAKVEIESV